MGAHAKKNWRKAVRIGPATAQDLASMANENPADSKKKQSELSYLAWKKRNNGGQDKRVGRERGQN